MPSNLFVTLPDWLREEYAVIEQRRRRFEERVRRWPVRHVLYRQVLERMVWEGQYRDSKADVFGKIADLTPEEIQSCIRQLIADLETYPHYEIALTNEPPREELQTYWEVVGDTCLFVVADQSRSLLNVAIKQKRVLQLQKNYFAHHWERFPKADKDRAQVIAFLKSLLGE
jgi:hypothetical protein